MNRVVIASSNPGKLRELSALLGPLGIEAVPQSDFAVPEAEEPHFTFLENALAKARHAANMTGLPALADDSGLCVPALFGEPGVHSAYYAGKEGGREERDARNNAKLVEQLRAAGDRSAFYYCVLVLVRNADDPTPIVADGTWHGEIVLEPRGANGFGYDPYFLVKGGSLTAAELPTAEKNRASHRGQALATLASKLSAASWAPRFSGPRA
ncbi:MAG: RdgB/HAM1 family non-canonical purine NTP pyrophosphatase [Usitatibacter sp.]